MYCLEGLHANSRLAKWHTSLQILTSSCYDGICDIGYMRSGKRKAHNGLPIFVHSITNVKYSILAASIGD